MRIFSLLLLLNVSVQIALHSQIIGGRGNGQLTPAEVKPSEINAGGFSGDVSLFTGTYNSQYTLGSVTDPSGLSFTANLSYSSTFESGDNLPHVSGIPYGEGWSVELPMISVSTEDFNKYTQQDLTSLRNGLPTNNLVPGPQQSTPKTPSFNRPEDTDEDEQEGDLFYYAPTINIPGVVSGRMVYKYSDGNEKVFVLHAFERYVEARTFSGQTWVVILDDGTRYEFALAMINHGSASNQRLKNLNWMNNLNQPLPTESVVLPKTSYLSWYCTEISHRNMTGNIRFTYESFGCFDYFQEYTSLGPLTKIDQAFYNYTAGIHAPLFSVCKDLVIKSVESLTEKLAFNYASVPTTGASNMLALNGAGVTRLDSMYSKKLVKNWNTSEVGSIWKRYTHIKSNEANGWTTCSEPPSASSPDKTLYAFNSPTDPYLALGQSALLVNGNNRVGYVQVSNPGNNFNHSFFESPAVPFSIDYQAGELYEIRTNIQSKDVDCTYDINIGTGDHSPGATQCDLYTNGSVRMVNADYIKRTRGTSVYNTFNQAIKWYTQPGTILAANPQSLETVNLFMMPNLPTRFQNFYLQVGPGSSDTKFSMPPVDIVGSGNNHPYPWRSYYNVIASGNSNYDNTTNFEMKTGDPVRGNFGIGLAWWMMRNFYGVGFQYSGTSIPDDFWWNTCPINPTYGNYPNQPTPLVSGTSYSRLDGASIYRISKNPYMLKTVDKYVYNPGGSYADYEANGVWRLASRLKMEYAVQLVSRYASAYQMGGNLKETVQKGDRNIFLLKKIKQMPVLNVPVNFNETTAPTTHFSYQSYLPARYTNGNWTNYSQYNSNFYVLNQVIDPMGKEMTIDYRPIATFKLVANSPQNTPTDSSYTFIKFLSIPRYNDVNTLTLYNPGNDCSSTSQYMPGDKYAFQTYMVVKSITIKDRLTTASQVRDYTFSGLRVLNDNTILDKRFYYDGPGNLKAGFQSCTVLGPANNTKRLKTIYYHKTDELPDGLLWGKLYKIENYDASTTPKLIKKQEMEYEVTLAFENIQHRGYGNTTFYHYDYNDYMLYDYGTNAFEVFFERPMPTATITGPADVAALNAYYTQIHNYYGINNLHRYAVTDPGFDFFYSPEIQREFQGPGGHSGTYEVAQYYAHVEFQPDFNALGESSMPFHLNSYFIKKTRDKTTSYEAEITDINFATNGLMKEIETITDYTYFDADYAGRSKCPGYGAIGLTQYAGNTYQLFWEPSWQLHSTKTYSPQMGGTPDSAYTLEEKFYFYDLANNRSYQQNAASSLHGLKWTTGTHFEWLYNLWTFKQMRTLPYETRVTVKAPGIGTPTRRSTYYQYDTGWELGRDSVIWEEVIADPNWPCWGTGGAGDDDNPPVVPGGGTPTYPSIPCKVIHGAPPPPGYCAMPQAPYLYCLCGTTTTSSTPEGFSGPNSPNTTASRKGQGGGGTASRPYTGPGAPSSPYTDPDTEERPPVSIKGMVLLKKVIEQVKPSTNGNVLAFNDVTGQYIYPAGGDTQTVHTILQRNVFAQPVRQMDARGTITAYDFEAIRVIEKKTCINNKPNLETIFLNNHIGLPVKIIIGSGRVDSLVTEYKYNSDNTVQETKDPNGIVLSYVYDIYGRMSEHRRNGTTIQKIVYHQWENNTAQTFAQRAYENYVETETFTSATSSWKEKVYMDPLNRKVGTKKDGYMMEDIIYDSWNQPFQQLKSKVAALPTITPSVTPPVATVTTSVFEDSPSGRVTKTAKFGELITGTRTVNTGYYIAASSVVQAFLTYAGQTSALPAGTRFLVNKVTDEDGKYSIEIANSQGQKVVIVSNNGTIATVIKYDNLGNVTQVNSPRNLVSRYFYNYLGKKYLTTTPDEGSTYFVYDPMGMMVARKDARNITRLYKYDGYGRQVEQIRKIILTTAQNTALYANQGAFWVSNRSMSDWTSLFGSNYYYEKRWFYHSLQNSLVTTYATTNTQNYVLNNTTYSKGKPTLLMTYGSAGSLVEIKYLSYDAQGFTKWEINQFNFNGLSAAAKGMVLAMSYPDYNRQGSLLTQNIDLDCDGVLDFQYYTEYDTWNRQLRTFANYSDAKNTGSKIVELLYDNIVGAVDKKTYFDHASGCSNVQVDQIDYDYDTRFRLTRIGSYLFDYDLKYDGNAFSGYTTNISYNYNGNINSARPTYKLNLTAANPANFAGTSSINTWNYIYDNFNRLTKADANITGVLNWGDSDYSYDKVGNIGTLKRYSYDYTPGTLQQDNFTYNYTANTNKLTSVLRGAVNDRTIMYDENGNMSSDTKRKIAVVSYGRMNLPFNQAITVAANTTKNVAMLYDIKDARIFKRSVTTIGNTYPPNATVNGSEYYIHTLTGQEIGVYDFLNDKLTWYVFAGDRVAKIEHTPATTFGDGVDPGPGGGGGGGSSATGGGPASKIFASAKYSDMNSIEANANENGKLLLNSLRKVLGANNQVQLPATLVLVEYPDQKQAWVLKNELTKVKGGYSEKSLVVLEDARSQLQVPMLDGSTQAVVLGEALGLFRAQQKPFVQGYDPSVQALLLAPPPPPIPQPVFYIYDHLGNTRVTFHVDITCPSTKTYVLDYAAEYYPYGKTMRDYTNGTKEKYETTQHERDQESGLDYRGARFYDGDIARFLSVDPLAKEYIALSPYNYVAGNPILVVDPDGKENILYVYAPNVSQRDAIIASINSQSAEMGLGVKAVPISYIPESSSLDKSDSFVYFGSGSNVKDDITMLNKYGYSFAENALEGYTLNKWDVSNNPAWGDGDNLIMMPLDNLSNAVDMANGTGEYTKDKLGQTESNFTGMQLEDVAANMVLHGSGHNAGIGHEKNTIMEGEIENKKFKDGEDKNAKRVFDPAKALIIMKTITEPQLKKYKEKYNASEPKQNLPSEDKK